MDKDFIRNAVKALNNLGIGTYVQGCYDVGPDDAVLYVTNEEEFYAAKEGLTLNEWRAKEAYNQSLRCTGITKKGTQCKNSGEYISIMSDGFKVGQDDRCRLHKEAK